MKLSTPSLALTMVTLGAWTIVTGDLIFDVLPHKAFIAAVSAGIVAPLCAGTSHIAMEIRRQNSVHQVIQSMTRGDVRARLDAADACRQSWSDTGPLPIVDRPGRN